MYVSKYVRIHGYFVKLKGVSEQKCLGDNSLRIFGNKSLTFWHRSFTFKV
jgi:hypothetical protein